VIPGLIDTHVHLNLETLEREAAYDAWIQKRAPLLLQEYLERGFTTILSMGDAWPGIVRVRDKLRSGDMVGPRLLVTGPMIMPPNGHGVAYSPKCSAVPYCAQAGWYREVGTEDQARALIDDLAAHGADGVKIANEPTTLRDGSPGGFPPGVLNALIDRAHRHQLRVYVHPASVDYAVQALQTGTDALAHGAGIELVDNAAPASAHSMSDLAKIAIENKAPVSTTVGGFAAYLPADKAQIAMNDARRLFDAGVTLSFGTDGIGTVGAKREFPALVKSGFSPREILQMATIDAAKLLGQERTIGSIEVGKAADLVMLANDPLQSSAFLDRVDLTVKGGVVAFDYYAQTSMSAR
jgi:imidazolonepropionase-like amidohydrolase